MIYGGELYRDDCNKVSFILNSYQDHLDSIKEFPDCHRSGNDFSVQNCSPQVMSLP